MKINRRDREKARRNGLPEYSVRFSLEDRQIIGEVIRLSSVVDQARKTRSQEEARKGTVPGIVCAADAEVQPLSGHEELRDYLMMLSAEQLCMLRAAFWLGQQLYWDGFGNTVDSVLSLAPGLFISPWSSMREADVRYLLGKRVLTVYLQLALIKLNE